MSYKLIALIYSRQISELPAKRKGKGKTSPSAAKAVLVHLADERQDGRHQSLQVEPRHDG